MKSNLLGAIAMFLLLIAACTPGSQENTQNENQSALIQPVSQPTVSPPIAGLNVPMQHFEVLPDQDKTIDLPNGTQINIPAGTLVDENGQAVSGPVDLAYREFHDAIDVFMSGIPMTYKTSEGEEEIFQTAGMLEINASQNGKQIFIAEGKSIQIEMASFVEPPANSGTLADDYQLYYLNESTGLWEDRGENNPIPNPRKINIPDTPEVLPEKPMKPKKPAANEVVFNFAVDYKNYPQLAPYDGIAWQYANVASDEPGMINPNEEKWVFNQVWTDARVKERDAKNALYELQIRNNKKKARMIVTPVLEGDKYTTAMQKYQEIARRIQVAKAQEQAEWERMNQQAKMVRAFEVNQFGTYNCDRFYRISDARVIAADFTFPIDETSAENKLINIVKVYHLIPQSRAVITYQKLSNIDQWTGMTYSPSEKNYLVAMLPGNELALFGPEDFASLTTAKSQRIDLKATGKKIESPDQLRQLLSM